ncbi:MAG: hypothetical protein ABW076_07395 [Candidatus Thiodiazotropha sp.]
MKFTAIAYLFTGLITAAFTHVEDSRAEGYAQPAPWESAPGWTRNAPAATHRGYWQPNGTTEYRFRPWTEREARLARQHSAAYPAPFQAAPWSAQRPPIPSNNPMHNRTVPQYRFRPMNPAQPDRVTKAGFVYRPMQIQIPREYVYRPLNPVKATPRGNYRPPVPSVPRYAARPVPPFGNNYRGYPNYPLPPMGVRSQPESRYVYGHRPVAPRFRPWSPAERYVADYPRMYPRAFPGVAYRDPRVRPFQGYPRTYAWRPRQGDYRVDHRSVRNDGPRTRYPNWLRGRPAWGYPEVASSAPYVMGPGDAQAHADVQNRYGVDWYDGRSDGDGAWYKLMETPEWPRVTQRWSGD